ncbi:DUF262 domain-containing protein [Hasllibacter sp. MH4015]|uniref:DUF262 domain-containing protein n=1 Tax=Hasllibacter sp. MH4015 TaxID=2854029 RepID=UPI001CD5F4FE|nr:DUF262 domain-containing protein [Hasllibacter sp. MH4015]
MSKITHNTGETSFDQVIGAGNIYVIPYFQRPYKWAKPEIEGLIDDIERVADAEVDSHFCGAIIIAQQPSKPSDPNAYEIVDGQQRMTSIFITLCAVITLLSRRGDGDEARKLFHKYIIHTEKYLEKSNAKIQSSQLDRKSMNDVIESTRASIVNTVEDVSQIREFHPLSTSALAPNQTVKKNYDRALVAIQNKYENSLDDGLERFLSALLSGLPVVQIDVIDPTSGPIIFDRLNSKQKPMTIGDLVKNAIFQKSASRSPVEVEKLHDDIWTPFYGRFQDDRSGKNLFDSFFFPYGLISDPSTKKSEVFNKLQKEWQTSTSPEQVVERLAHWQPAFMDIVTGTELHSFDGRLKNCISRPSRFRLPSSALPFLMSAYRSAQLDEISQDEAAEIFDFTEGFLVRRALCGVEPTGLHALFKDLWKNSDGGRSADALSQLVRTSPTIFWPDDTAVHNAVIERPVYTAKITNYVLAELNRASGGDVPPGDIVIEHVLPQKVKAGTYVGFSPEDRKSLTHTLANLLPLSPSMNPGIGNLEYKKKRAVYAEDSMYKHVREFAAEYEDWTPEALRDRAERLSDWVLTRWPLPA